MALEKPRCKECYRLLNSPGNPRPKKFAKITYSEPCGSCGRPLGGPYNKQRYSVRWIPETTRPRRYGVLDNVTGKFLGITFSSRAAAHTWLDKTEWSEEAAQQAAQQPAPVPEIVPQTLDFSTKD